MHSLQTKTHNVVFDGDFSGNVRFSNADDDVELPFETIKEVVSEWVRRSRISRIEDATADEILGFPK